MMSNPFHLVEKIIPKFRNFKITFKKIIFFFFLQMLATAGFAMSKQEVVDYINHAHNKKVIKHQSKHPTNKLHWENINGPNVSIALRVIKATSHPNILYILNNSEPYFIYKSLDGGATWSEIPLPNEAKIQNLLATDENSLILATQQGIYLSHDQGMHWIYSQNSPAKTSYLYLHALNPQWLLAINSDGYYLEINISMDGGLTWQAGGIGLERLVGDNYSNVTSFGKSVAIHTVNGVSVSTDGGFFWSYKNPHWIQKDLPYADSIYKSIAMSSNLDFYVSEGRYDRAGQPTELAIYKTDVEGKKWEKIFDDIGKIVLDKKDNIYILNYDNGFYTIHKSIDQGTSWKPVKQFNASEYYIYDIEILDNNRILLWTHEGVLASDEEQLNFNLLSIQLPKSDIYSLIAADDKTLLAVDDYKNQLYRSVDGGISWKKNDVEEARKLFMMNDQLSLSSADTILTSKDKGLTWDVKNKFNQNITRLSNNADTAWIVLHDGSKYLSHDLENWIQYAKKYEYSKDAINGNRIYSAYSPECCNRQPGGIKYSDDNGKSWNIILDGIYQDALAISAYQTNLIVVAYSSGVIKSKDGGKQWEVINAGLTDYDINDLIIVDENNYILATSHNIFRTQDGGEHWVQETEGPYNKLISSIFADQHHLLVGTNGSGIYKSDRI